VLDVVLSIVEIGLLVYCLIDCLQTDSLLVRNLPKLAWVALIVLVPVAGSIAWLVAGRPLRQPPRPAGTIAPDDDPDFLRGLRRPPDDPSR
jgi:hypothetical protein